MTKNVKGTLMRLANRFSSKFSSGFSRKRKFITTVAMTCGALAICFCFADLFSVRPQASAVASTTFTVTSTDDSGAGTLRQAILDANGNAGADIIAFNIPGPGVHTINPAMPLPTITDPVMIDGYTQPGSSVNTLADGDNAVLLIELNGSGLGGSSLVSGVQINSSNCTVRGLVINRFQGAAVFLSSPSGTTTGNLVEGNFLGTDPSGTLRLGNNDGIDISFSTNNVIGGTTPASRNIISGNSSRGVFLGTMASSTTIQGNFIGTNASGTSAIGNNSGGIFAGGLGNDVIGGTAAGARNVISGNAVNAGVFVTYGGASLIIIQGNLIGTDVSGTVALGNFFGIWVNHGVSNAATVIGGVGPAARNVVSGNRSHGVYLTGSTRGSQIQGNLIGTDINGTGPLGNLGNGVQIESTGVNNRVGGTSPGQGNTIAFNSRNGVFVSFSAATGNSIRGNSIFSNAALGIDLGGNGVTPNDPGDGDTGPNNLQNFPVISSVSSNGAQTTITGTLNSTPNDQFSVDFYSSSSCDPSGNGEGTTPFGLSAIVVTTDANGNGSFGVAMSIPLQAGQVITATATDSAGNTSEFSPCDTSKATGSVHFATGSLRVIEDVGFVTVNVLRTGGSTGTLRADYTTADITATAGSDYVPTSGTLTFNDGETSKSIDIPVLDDAISEPDESFVVHLKNGTNIDSIDGPSEELITLQDHGTPPVLSINDISVTEGNSGTTNATFTVTLSPLTGRSVTVNYQTDAGSATSGVDFTPSSGTLTFGARQTSRTIVVPIIGDTIDEFNESFRVLLTNPSIATIANGGAPATGTIIDDDPPPIVSISDASVVEGNSGFASADLNLSLSQPSGKLICVQASTAAGTATVASGDYVHLGGLFPNPPPILFFSPGVTSTTFSPQVRGDAQFEPNETFFVNITPCGNITIGRGQGVVTIINDDLEVLPSISITDVAVSDGSGPTNAVFDVSLSAPSTQTVTVQYATGGGTATSNADFQSVSGTLSFGPGVTHQLVTVPIIPDSSAEGNETFNVNLSNPIGGTLADSQGLCTISDGPPSQLPFLTVDDITVVEGPSGKSDVDFTVKLSQASSQQVSFQFAAAPGTATANVDYLNVSGGALLVPGMTRFIISVPIVGDQTPEPNETFFMNISNASGATIADNQGMATIVDYVTPSIQFAAPSVTIGENAGNATLNITRTGNNLTTSVVDVVTADGSATQRTDYTISAATLTFLPGESSKSFEVPIVDDFYSEGDETLKAVLSNPTGAVLSVANSMITIADNDLSQPTSNPLDNADARFFVREHYNDFLNRQPDQSGIDFWTGQITQCGSDQNCTRNKRVDVSNAFFYELEYQQTGSYVYRLYRSAFGNNQPSPNTNPDPVNPGEEKKLMSYQAFASDRARVVGGTTLAQSQFNLANAFVQRPEFLSKYAAGLNGPDFVDALLATLLNDIGVDLGPQRQALINLFNAGGRGAVLYRLADDNAQTNPINNRALIDAEYNRAFVATQYFGYLRRDPDMAGFLFWLGQVNNAPLRNVPKQHAMVCSFMTSIEYQQRFSSIAPHTNEECPR